MGPGETVTISDDPLAQPEGNEVLWTEPELDAIQGLSEADPKTYDMWVKYLDAVKRMYPGCIVRSLVPLRIDHPELTPEKLERIPWQMLPRR